LWFMVSFLKLPFALKLYDLGIGHNLSVLLLNEYWRLFTPIFLHADLSHVVFNTFSLVLFGPALEKMIGKFKFISIYLITGIIGNIGTFIRYSIDHATSWCFRCNLWTFRRLYLYYFI